MTSSTRASHRHHRKHKSTKYGGACVSSIVCIDPVTKEVRTPLPLMKDSSKPTIVGSGSMGSRSGNIRVDKSQASLPSGQQSPTTMVLENMIILIKTE
jgi:hypothetical protein